MFVFEDTRAMHGYLLAGGRSTRFGADKRQAKLAGVGVAARAALALTAAVGPNGQVAAVGPPQSRLASLGLPWVDDAVPEAGHGPGRLGPCAGLLAATQRGGGLVLACDMPCVPARALRALAHLADGFRPAAPLVAGRLMPLSAFWPARAAAALEAELVFGRGRVTDAFRAAGGLAVPAEEIGLGPDDAWLFTSVNTPYDLNELARQMRARGGLGL